MVGNRRFSLQLLGVDQLESLGPSLHWRHEFFDPCRAGNGDHGDIRHVSAGHAIHHGCNSLLWKLRRRESVSCHGIRRRDHYTSRIRRRGKLYYRSVLPGSNVMHLWTNRLHSCGRYSHQLGIPVRILSRADRRSSDAIRVSLPSILSTTQRESRPINHISTFKILLRLWTPITDRRQVLFKLRSRGSHLLESSIVSLLCSFNNQILPQGQICRVSWLTGANDRTPTSREWKLKQTIKASRL